MSLRQKQKSHSCLGLNVNLYHEPGFKITPKVNKCDEATCKRHVVHVLIVVYLKCEITKPRVHCGIHFFLIGNFV